MAKEKEQDQFLHMRVNAEFWDWVDSWRREQSDIPVRSEAVRRMVRLAASMRRKEAMSKPEKTKG